MSSPSLSQSVDSNWSVPSQGAAAVADTRVQTYRWMTMAIAMSMLWKARYYPAAFQWYRDLQLEDAFFPAAFRSSAALAAFVIVPLLLAAAVMVIDNRHLFRIQAVATLFCTAGLCWHQGSYNDVTFLTCFWASAWCTWFAFSMEQPPDRLLPKAAKYAVMVMSLMFLGGAMGKFTPGYWSGEVLYQIYFVDRDFWFFNLLRSQLDAESLRGLATIYSRFVVVAETACIFLWLLPARWGAAIALVTFCGIVTLSNFNLLSVMWCMLGLGVAAFRSGATRAAH